MKVHLNKPMLGQEEEWKAESGRRLLLINKTEQTGRVLHNINLGYMRKGKTSYIFLNNPHTRPSSKTVGIFVSPEGYIAFCGERFSGKTKGVNGIDGMFGIYDTGTLIEMKNGTWYELFEEEGWKITREL